MDSYDYPTVPVPPGARERGDCKTCAFETDADYRLDRCVQQYSYMQNALG